MMTREERTAKAYREGNLAGYMSIVKQTLPNPNPYVDATLRETWAAGFNDGIDEASDEEE